MHKFHNTILIFSLVFFIPGVFADVLKLDIKEWNVPWEDTRPRDPYVDLQGRVWFCGQNGAYIAMLDPATGEFKKYDMEDGERPHNLIIDDKHTIWFAGNTRGYIGQLNPDTGAVRKYPMPDDEVKDPHTLVFDTQGNIWFTAQLSNYVGRFSIETGEIKVPTPHARPYGIWMDANDRPWIALFGTNKLATVDPVTLVLTEIALPREQTLPRRLAVTSDNHVWYVDYREGYLGEYDPENKTFNEWPMPGESQSYPYGMIVDDQDRLWFVETGGDPNRLVGFDPASSSFFSITNIPSGGGSIRHMYYHPSQRAIWFGTDSNTVGRAIVPE